MLRMLHLLLCRHFATCTAHDAAQTLAHTHKICAAGRIDFFKKKKFAADANGSRGYSAGWDALTAMKRATSLL